MEGCKSGWAADAQQAGWLKSSMRSLKLRLLNIFEGRLETVIIGKAGFCRAATACRPADEFDSDVFLYRSQRSADGLERTTELMSRHCQTGLLHDGDKGLKVANPVQSHSPDYRENISCF
jgi:hypothetical protein